MRHTCMLITCDGSKANIWLFWNSFLSTPNVISTTAQAITVKVGEVLVTGIHATCLTMDIRELWDELEKIDDMDCPWLEIGDFNVILSSDEKVGGRRPLRIVIQDFRDCLNICNLIQAPKTGIKYSRCNNRVGKMRILCDLDKTFFNVKRLENFDGWQYKVGVRRTSDHGPIVGNTVGIPKPNNIPFRYQVVWTSHPDFLNLVQRSWEEIITGNPAFVFMAKLKRFKKFVKKWNCEIFWDLRVKMSQVEEDVEKAAMIYDANPENVELLNYLITARGNQEIVSQKFNELLRAKDRIKWVKEGGENTSFFHSSMKIRKAHNNIVELEDDNRNMVTNQAQIADILVNHFQKKFEYQPVSFDEIIIEVIPKIISEEDNMFLDGIPSSAEIKEDVYGMEENSSPGPDGFSESFYRFAWNIVGQDLSNAIQYCWRCKFIPRDDIFVFGNGQKKSLENLMKLLMDYQNASGQVINKMKNKYLGVILCPGRVKSYQAWGMVELMHKMLAVWMGKMLSFSDILTLVKSVLCSVLVYNMSVYKWPKNIIKECEKIVRNFLWSGDPAVKNLITVKFDEICALVTEGGLGIKRFETINKALLMKLL
ncbi:uncharacterized protein LOC113351647 [Papaver somniferum]|uniref:uncharacterized protein LOC113351647 n=1 Tax=Papaver somniferum TaxID=3469 RepID=UPI000E70224A|nr:uncharacterized protein LOC113351647 [Papaver somniferum]